VSGRVKPRGAVAEALRIAVGVAVGLALVNAFVARPYTVPSDSMRPTLEPGDGVLVSRLAYRLSAPRRGDVVVLHPPAGARDCGVAREPLQACPRPRGRRERRTFIKRVVALPGDRLAVRGGRPVVNGRAAREPMVTLPCRPPSRCELPDAIVIPPGHVFVMGDNRGASVDSRHWGPVPRAWIVGEAVLAY
jgi:signal peptidase I